MLLRYAGLILAASLATARAGTIDVVVPNANTSVNGNSFSASIFGEGSASYTFQWELAASQLTSLVGDSLTGIEFRLSSGSATVNGPTTIGSFGLELSPAVNPIGSLSTTFANNIGAGGVVVYSGSLILGTLTGGAGPNPFFLISFSTPYAYSGGNLVMTETISGGSSFSVDANAVGDGLGDTVSGLGGPTKAEFFDYPITEFQAQTATPEPATFLALAGGLLVLGAISFGRNRG